MESELIEFKSRNKEHGYSYLMYPLTDDSLYHYDAGSFTKLNRGKKIELAFFAPRTTIQYNSSAPFPWNDGSMVPNKGIQSFLTTGFFVKKGIFSMQLRPEWVYAQGQSFMGFPSTYNDTIWASRYLWFNRIDQPERWPSDYQIVLLGQSNLKFQYKKLSAGISTENLWWGPGRFNSLLMTNNAPGFPHVFLRSERPLQSKIGKFEFQFIAGQLQGSDQFPPDTARTFRGSRLYRPKPQDDRRYLNGFIISYQPSFIKGMSLGLGRVVYLYNADVTRNFDGYLPVFGFLFKKQTNQEDSKRRDQMLSLYIKQSFFEGKTEFYLEFGRNDHAWNFRDLIKDLSHSKGYVLGFNQQVSLPKRKLFLNIEVTDLSRTYQLNLRPTPNWYTHHQVLHGYSHFGQVVGAGIGPGSTMESVQIDILKTSVNFYGFGLYRIVRNKDFFYDTFRNQNNRKWVDIAFNCKWSHSFDRVNLLANCFLVRSFNYQYQDDINSLSTVLKDGKDMINFSANVTVQYKL